MATARRVKPEDTALKALKRAARATLAPELREMREKYRQRREADLEYLDDYHERRYKDLAKRQVDFEMATRKLAAAKERDAREHLTLAKTWLREFGGDPYVLLDELLHRIAPTDTSGFGIVSPLARWGLPSLLEAEEAKMKRCNGEGL